MRIPVTQMTEPLYAYLLQMASPEPDILRRLREETERLPNARWATTPAQAGLLGLLVRLGCLRQAVEVGTFTGYGALALALALPADGRVITCDITRDNAQMGERYWREAGLDRQIELRIGPAADTLRALRDADGPGSIDLVFIDADKENYPDYLELTAELLHPGGVLVADNVLWGGAVIDDADTTADTAGIRRFNDLLREDVRFTTVMLPVSDGMTLALRN